MKKIISGILLIGGILFLSSKMYAGEPQDQGIVSGRFFHTRIYGSTTTTTNVAVGVTLAATSSASGGQTINYQTCITKFIVQLSSTASFAVYDGATTTIAIMNIFGAGLGATTPAQFSNTISIPEDHLGPLCGTPGNAFNLLINTGTVSGVSGPMSINYEGYTTAGAGSISN